MNVYDDDDNDGVYDDLKTTTKTDSKMRAKVETSLTETQTTKTKVAMLTT